MAAKRKLVVVDSSDLDDSDWPVINRLKRAYEADGDDAFFSELQKLFDTDPVRHLKALLAFFPRLVIETVKDHLAATGTTPAEALEDLQKAKRKAESPAGDQ